MKPDTIVRECVILGVWAREELGNSANGNVGDDYVSMAGFRGGYVLAGPMGGGLLRGTPEYFFDIIPVFVVTKPKVIYGGGVSPFGRKWNFVNRRLKPFLEVSFGGIFSTRDVPPGDTSNFNFTVSRGGGVAIFTNARHALTAKIGFWHLSNATIGRTNPSLNALELGIEYHPFCRSGRLLLSRQFQSSSIDMPVACARMRLLFFGPPVEGVTTVDSGSILPGEQVWILPRGGGFVRSVPEATTVMRVPDGWLDGRGQTIPTRSAPAGLCQRLEENRKAVGIALAELAQGKRFVAETWARQLYGRCVVPFPVFDPIAATRASV